MIKSVFDVDLNIELIKNDYSLYEEGNFNKRAEAIDFIEFHIIDYIKSLLQQVDPPAQILSLKYRAEKLKEELEEIDLKLFKTVRASIQTGNCIGKDFKDLVRKYVDFNLDSNEYQAGEGYDNLDALINGLLLSRAMPEETKKLEPEMVFYQKTPARVVFELTEKIHFGKDDVFFDLGSGLGQVAILVNLLTGNTAKGIEFEPAFCHYARECVSGLNLSDVTFINADARKTDYSEGTIFFMYTPFKGKILRDVLEVLRKESLARKIKIVTYGPCTAEVALQKWLDFAPPKDTNIYKLGVFTSL